MGELWGQHPFNHYNDMNNSEIVIALEKQTLIPQYPNNSPQTIKEIVAECLSWDVSKRPSFLQILEQMEKIPELF